MNLPENEKLSILYIPLNEATLWDENPKEHDFDSLASSIGKYGFQDPAKFDSTLNNGEGGIVFGNGRTYVLQYMMSHGFARPKGVGEDENGMWYVPVLMGNDLETESKAKAFALDHNLLGVVGVNGITHLDAVRMYDSNKFLEVAQDLDMIATDDDDLDLMRMLMDRQSVDLPEEPVLEDEKIESNRKPSVSFKFSTEVEKSEFLDTFEQIWSLNKNSYDEKGDFLIEVVSLYMTDIGI